MGACAQVNELGSVGRVRAHSAAPQQQHHPISGWQGNANGGSIHERGQDDVRISFEAQEPAGVHSCEVASAIAGSWAACSPLGDAQKPGMHQGFVMDSRSGVSGLTPGFRPGGVFPGPK